MARGLRFWVEVALALASALTVVLVLLRPDWIEVLFGVDPDAGTGVVESVLAATDVRNLAEAAKAAAKLGEIDKQLSTLSGNGRVEKARVYVAGLSAGGPRVIP